MFLRDTKTTHIAQNPQRNIRISQQPKKQTEMADLLKRIIKIFPKEQRRISAFS